MTEEPPALPPGAGFFRRVAATFVDAGLFLVLTAALAYPLARSVAASAPKHPIDALEQLIWMPELQRLGAATAVAWVALWWLYVVFGWGVVGTTPGKAMLGLVVVDWRGRMPIGPARAVLRLAAYTLSSATLGLGHLLVIFRSDHRALHDLLAGTRVVRRRALHAP